VGAIDEIRLVTSEHRPFQNTGSEREEVVKMPVKSPRVKLGISSSSSSSAAGDAKSVPEVQGMVDEQASSYPTERVRVLGSLVNVKPNTTQDGATSFTVFSRSGSNKGLPKWKVILVFKDANDTSKNPHTIDVICWLLSCHSYLTTSALPLLIVQSIFYTLFAPDGFLKMLYTFPAQ